MKFLVPNYSCLQNPRLGAYRPPDPHSVCPLSSTEFGELPANEIPGNATVWHPSLCQYQQATTVWSTGLRVISRLAAKESVAVTRDTYETSLCFSFLYSDTEGYGRVYT